MSMTPCSPARTVSTETNERGRYYVDSTNEGTAHSANDSTYDFYKK